MKTYCESCAWQIDHDMPSVEVTNRMGRPVVFHEACALHLLRQLFGHALGALNDEVPVPERQHDGSGDEPAR